MDAAAASDVLTVTESIDRHPLVSLVSACFWVILWLLSWTKSLVAFVTISVPRFVYAVLSYSMTLTLGFWNFAILFICSAIALNYWIRFKYLNDYMQLKEPPLVKPDVNELHPDVNTGIDPPPTFHNYLDEFLQAVRVFGFLEKPVFHELARHLQTRRLIAGDSLSLDQDKSFYCVVEGTVQVFAQTGHAPEVQHSSWDDEDMNGYQLLNEVGSGGTLSSLFTILSLFTEDVQMSWQDEYPDVSLDDMASFDETNTTTLPRRRARRSNSDVSQYELGGRGTPQKQPIRRSSVSSTASTVNAREFRSPLRVPTEYSTQDDNHSTSGPPTPPSHPSKPPRPSQIHRGVVARATVDTTLAVIPAEAFRRLTKKFPKATGHIVQVILTRFSRVTFNAAHKYLGLTSEVLRTEKAINDIACHPLPPSFYEGGGLQYLRHRFDGTGSSASESESDYFSFSQSHPPPLNSLSSSSDLSKSRDSSTVSLGKINDNPIPIKPSFYKQQGKAATIKSPRQMVQAGDLFVAKGNGNDVFRPLSRSFSLLNTPRLGQNSLDNSDNTKKSVSQRSSRWSADDFDLREEVMSCIAKSIGLLQPPMSGNESTEELPASPPSEYRSTTTKVPSTFNSPFGSLSLLDLGDDASSMTGGSITSMSNNLRGLDNEVEILFYAAGTTLAKAGELNIGLFYVIEGFLDILLPVDDTKKNQAPSFPKTPRPEEHDEYWRSPSGPTAQNSQQKLLFTVKPGGIAGYLASLCNTASYVDIKAKTDTYVGFLPLPALERILEKRPIVLLTLAKRLISLLSPLNASLDWMQVNAGQVLWRPQDVSDSFYIVINGRLRAITETENGEVTILGEYGQGDTVGELDVITSSPRRSTVHAIRDTELIRMPQTLFNAISARNPQTTAQLLRMIASRVRDEVDSSSTGQQRKAGKGGAELGYNNTNLKTVAVLPVSRNVPVEAFAKKLQQALEGIGASTAYLNQATIANQLGRHAFTRMGKLKSAGWLANQEQRFHTVLYVADSPVNSSWTQTCIRQADCVMVVGMGDDPSIGEYERLLLSMKTTARKELVLLHPDRSVTPGTTREWLKNRPWVHQHIHMELPGLVLPIPKSAVPKDPDAVTALKNLKDKVQSEIQKYRRGTADVRPQRLPHTNDFSRLARRICGRSIGLVLGGGGARGIAHLGVIRALEEYGIPIDHIAGTSIGAFIGGLYAREGDLISSTGRAKQFSGRMGNIWRILSDVTYPIVAYTTGHEFNRALYKAFYDLHIEDMWLPYFCNTTNIITSRMEIHETGYAWRFIRASMTLVGLLPPLCDNGNLLVDGGYIDNLPVAAMTSMGASFIFASDVGSIDDNSPRNFGDTVSGWWLLINRWNPFSNARHVPAITEIQSRLAYVSSVNTLEQAKIAKNCLYFGMPVQEYGTMQFGKFEELLKKGYHAAIDILDKMEEEGRLPAAVIDCKDGHIPGKKKGRSARRNSI
uniref:Lysophospholipase NTE1 n=1 Tax=Psilocybe cubensis TaxID=181762 RepID=A0A8H8CR46_PSICU